MATQRKIVVDIEADGSTNIDAQGFAGNSCATATRELELLLSGGDSSGVSDKKKPDFFNTIAGSNRQTN